MTRQSESEFIEYDGAAEIEQAWRDGLTPDPLLSVSEWSDQHRMLSSKASAEPGRWRTSRTPYLKEIMDALSPHSAIERVVFMKAAQLGATEMGSNWLGYVIHHAPGPMMAVWPTVDMAKRNSKQRIDPLIEESAALRALIAPARSRDSGNTILAKEFRGGVLVMTGANSAVGLRSMPVRYLFLDEVDGYPLDVEGEGDAISLAEARTRTFTRRKIFIVSTPTIAGVSSIEREYQASDQRRYFVPCPHCEHYQWLRFEQLRWDKGQTHTAAYYCESCEQAIAEHHKTGMLERGQWRSTLATVPTVPSAPTDSAGNTKASSTISLTPRTKTAGFHLSSLYSPVGWRSWADVAAAWESAISKESGSSAAIKTFKNTELGETWLEEGEAPDWQRLLERREDYRIGTVPLGGLLLVAGADVQKDRIEVSIWAFGRGKESWLVEHRVLMGDSAREAVWQRLAELLAERWSHASGAAMPLARLALDTGFATQEAYAFARRCHDPRLMPVKGVRSGAMGGAALIGTPTAVDVTQGGKKLRRGIKLYAVAVGMAKMEFYNNLRKAADVGSDGSTPIYPAGYVHLPKVDAEYVQQLCAESLITRHDRNGFAHREWQKMRERNEALDAYVYARAAASNVGLDRFEERHWRELEQQLGITSQVAVGAPSMASESLEVNPTIDTKTVSNTSVSTSTSRRVIRSHWLKRS
jgi:phage terminase large subunit GpA-like protein